jgi:hypothetical protein
MFELDRTASTSDLALQLPIMIGLVVVQTQEVMLKHREVIRDDEIILMDGPVPTYHGATLPRSLCLTSAHMELSGINALGAV